jgi:NodT family efflux transporter outer membrane factor (OMF) lipoprotein
MNRVSVIILALTPWLASCALGPTVRVPDTRLPAAYEAPTDVTGGQAAINQWWRLYADPQLETLVDRALAGAPDALSAEARLKEALAVRAGALAAFNPQGSLQASGAYQDTRAIGKSATFSIPGTGQEISLSPNGSTYNVGANFDVSWEIDLFGRRAATRRKADADLAAARFDYEASRASLAANVADQLFQARGLAIQLDDARETARIEHDLADIARKKADRGLGSNADADQAAAEAAQSQAQVADLEAQLHAARRTLLVLVGRGVDPLESLPTPASAGAPPLVPASVPGELMARRPDVREAAARLKSAAGQLKLDELALFPKFTLQPGVGLTSSNQIGFPVTSDFWSIGLGIAQPILDMPRLKTEIRAQGARADQAAIAYQKAVQTAYGEAENALVGLSADETRIRLLTAGEAKARSAYDAARQRYAAGLDDLTSALSAERTWRGARSALTGAEVQALRRSVQAFKALGGGWAPSPLAGGRAAG